MKSSSPSILVQEKEVSSTYPSFIRYSVTLLDLHDVTSASLTVSSPGTEQQLVVPITVVHAGETISTPRGSLFHPHSIVQLRNIRDVRVSTSALHRTLQPLFQFKDGTQQSNNVTYRDNSVT